MTNRLGYIPDPPDNRDLRFADLKAEVTYGLDVDPPPPVWSNAGLVLNVLSQGDLGSCVANATAQGIRMNMVYRSDPEPVLPSRLQLYFMARAAAHEEKIDGGTHLRTTFSMINKYGFCREDKYRYGYDVKQFARTPPIDTWPHSIDQRTKNEVKYWRIWEVGAERIKAIKHAVSMEYAVVFGVTVDDKFTSRPPPSTPILPPTGNIAGGHAMLVEGYDEAKRSFTILNSWGQGWGFGGRCYFAPEYLEEAHDIWVVEHVPRWSDT